MRLPDIELDDRRFDDLVAEARQRVAQACPEWNAHNVSDPGVALIDVFAWMTDQLLYRVNRIPDKLHVRLLELLGIQLAPPSAATAELRFTLASPPADPVLIPGGTEVETPARRSGDTVVFQVGDDFTIPAAQAAQLVACAIGRQGELTPVAVEGGRARPRGDDRLAFGEPPVAGNAIYLGFGQPLGRLLIDLTVDCAPARRVGGDPGEAPLRWHVSRADGSWTSADVLEDTTAGFEHGSGTIRLQLPDETGAAAVGERRAHWIRCEIAERRANQPLYQYAPEIEEISAAPMGASVPAAHAAAHAGETVGTSEGTPGQAFRLPHAPVLPPLPGETLQVRDPLTGRWEDWALRESFAESGADDRHYVLDPAAGIVEFGPAVRDALGGWFQHGAVPPRGAAIRMTRYRHGGGAVGNVDAHRLTVLRSALTGVDAVTNPAPASGGSDAETLENAKGRAALEFRTRSRAVTAADYELLALQASPRVSRAHCAAVAGDGLVELRLLGRVEPADRLLTHDELVPDEAVLAQVAAYLDERRTLGASVALLPAGLRGVTVVVDVQAAPLSDPQRIEEDIVNGLYRYLNPLVGGTPGGLGAGWPFGRALSQGELFGIVHGIGGVEFVRVLRLYETDLRTGEVAPQPIGTTLVLEAGEVIASGAHVVRVTRREL